jgi:hypothetical protein
MNPVKAILHLLSHRLAEQTAGLEDQYQYQNGKGQHILIFKDDMLDEAQSFLAKRLEGRADVVKTEALINDGYFGLKVSSRFRDRVGNLIVLPYRYESVWWYEKGKFEQKFYGHHGGLTPQEMETILYSHEIG